MCTCLYTNFCHLKSILVKVVVVLGNLRAMSVHICDEIFLLSRVAKVPVALLIYFYFTEIDMVQEFCLGAIPSSQLYFTDGSTGF